jgi:hypothetical protein
MKLARWIFAVAGVYGILVIAPLYFAAGQIAQNDPPAITHPEFFYGFIGHHARVANRLPRDRSQSRCAIAR